MQQAAIEHPSVSPFPVPWAVKLIEKLHLLYGSKFMQQWAGIDSAKLALGWAEELAGFTGEEIATGLKACKTRPWPPTLPEFMTLCRPQLDPETAFREAVDGLIERAAGRMGAWSHPAIYWAAVRMGAYEIRNSGYQAVRKRWESILAETHAAGHWDPIPEPALQLVAPGQNVTPRAEARELMAELKRATGLEVE